MEFLLVVFFIFVVIGFAARGFATRGGSQLLGELRGDDDRVNAALRNYGVVATNHHRVSSIGSGSRHGNEYRFTGVDKAGIPVSGVVSLHALGEASVEFDPSGAGARAARAQGVLVEEELVDPSTLDPEEQVRREVARRLDELQANRKDFLANDTDGDGIVDSEEWSAVRARVEAEVRSELGEASDSAASPASPEPEESVVEPSTSPDSHW